MRIWHQENLITAFKMEKLPNLPKYQIQDWVWLNKTWAHLIQRNLRNNFHVPTTLNSCSPSSILTKSHFLWTLKNTKQPWWQTCPQTFWSSKSIKNRRRRGNAKTAKLFVSLAKTKSTRAKRNQKEKSNHDSSYLHTCCQLSVKKCKWI